MLQTEVKTISQHPEVLIPDRLRQMVPDPSQLMAISFEMELGRMDDEHLADIAVLIVERGGKPEDPAVIATDNWYKVLESKKERIPSLSHDDQPLITFVATRWDDGLFFDTIVITPRLRGQGLGLAFLHNLYFRLSEEGYSYIGGNSNEVNINAFTRAGCYTTDQLIFDERGIRNFCPWLHDSPYSPIKFFDRELEERHVDPRFLKV